MVSSLPNFGSWEENLNLVPTVHGDWQYMIGHNWNHNKPVMANPSTSAKGNKTLVNPEYSRVIQSSQSLFIFCWWIPCSNLVDRGILMFFIYSMKGWGWQLPLHRLPVLFLPGSWCGNRVFSGLCGGVVLTLLLHWGGGAISCNDSPGNVDTVVEASCCLPPPFGSKKGI